jgi:hypothetical protein
MDQNRFNELLRLVERSIFHSELKNGYVISGVHVNLPVNGNMDYMFLLERRMICETARDARMEEQASAKILAHQLAYILEKEDRLDKPVFQNNEDGDRIQIGVSVIILDRSRIDFPKFIETQTEVYLNCSKEISREKTG